jgi:hypothetical protein
MSSQKITQTNQIQQEKLKFEMEIMAQTIETQSSEIASMKNILSTQQTQHQQDINQIQDQTRQIQKLEVFLQ